MLLSQHYNDKLLHSPVMPSFRYDVAKPLVFLNKNDDVKCDS